MLQSVNISLQMLLQKITDSPTEPEFQLALLRFWYYLIKIFSSSAIFQLIMNIRTFLEDCLDYISALHLIVCSAVLVVDSTREMVRIDWQFC